jgi:6-pyruvoyltetrahydropterin/6-carboxytetrahydropterin synthase
MRIAAIRRAHFNAAHRLFRPDWTDTQNKEIFGLCSNPNYHGHNYELEVRVSGEIDKQTGMLIDLKELKELIRAEVEVHFDHRNINLEVPEFCIPDESGAFLNPTAENMCVVIHNRLRAKLDHRYDLHIRLYETPRNFVEFPA